MADVVEDILKAVAKADKLDLRRNPEHRLQGSFIWNRVRSLRDDEGVPENILSVRVQDEYVKIKGYIDTKLGANRLSGPLVPVRGGTGDKVPPHLDLLDLAKRFTADLTADPASPRGIKIDSLAHDATDRRERSVLAIVWRAAYLVPELWTASADKRSATLNLAALDELLDRRLRSCERMAYNVSGQQAMLGVGETEDIPREKWDLSAATATSGWRDKTRVRLFEYPFVPNYFKSLVGNAPQWFEQKGSVPGGGTARLAYTIKPVGTRNYTDQTIGNVQSTTAWRFPPPAAVPNWIVSPGSDDGFGVATAVPLTGIVPLSYRIDLVPGAGSTGAQVLDSLFDYTTTTPSGEPIRADFWNRAWLFCDHVIALLFLEAFLFARRRRPGAQAESDLDTLVARRPVVSVRSSPNGAPKNVATPYVCLDGQVGISQGANDHVIMSSQDTDVVGTPVDRAFENTVISVNSLQVGDHVIIVNAPIYRAFSQDGEWGLENAIVMDVDSTVDNSKNRGGVRSDSIELQGHGTRRLTHLEYRTLMKDVVKSPFKEMVRRLKEQIAATPGQGFFPIQNTGQVVFKWSPFSDGPSQIEFAKGEAKVTSGPWWMAVFFAKYFSSADQALAALKKTVGGSMVAGTAALPTIPGFPVSFSTHVLVPVFEPAIKSKGTSRTAWQAYFTRASTGNHGGALILRPTEVDETMVPGLFLRGSTAPIGVVRPRVRVAG